MLTTHHTRALCALRKSFWSGLTQAAQGARRATLGALRKSYCLLLALAIGWLHVPAQAQPARATAIFAGGCFWCVEKDFEKLPGVIEAESGYTAGKTTEPTYAQIGTGKTGHTEAVRVIYDPAQVTYPQLVEYFWRHIDPTVKDQQFCDVGSQYRSGIYWQNEMEKKVVEASLAMLKKSGRFPVIHTEIAPASTFWLAETYHQDYYKKNAVRYNFYRSRCGRDQRVAQLWGTP